MDRLGEELRRAVPAAGMHEAFESVREMASHVYGSEWHAE